MMGRVRPGRPSRRRLAALLLHSLSTCVMMPTRGSWWNAETHTLRRRLRAEGGEGDTQWGSDLPTQRQVSGHGCRRYKQPASWGLEGAQKTGIKAGAGAPPMGPCRWSVFFGPCVHAAGGFPELMRGCMLHTLLHTVVDGWRYGGRATSLPTNCWSSIVCALPALTTSACHVIVQYIATCLPCGRRQRVFVHPPCGTCRHAPSTTTERTAMRVVLHLWQRPLPPSQRFSRAHKMHRHVHLGLLKPLLPGPGPGPPAPYNTAEEATLPGRAKHRLRMAGVHDSSGGGGRRVEGALSRCCSHSCGLLLACGVGLRCLLPGSARGPCHGVVVDAVAAVSQDERQPVARVADHHDLHGRTAHGACTCLWAGGGGWVGVGVRWWGKRAESRGGWSTIPRGPGREEGGAGSRASGPAFSGAHQLHEAPLAPAPRPSAHLCIA